MDSNTSSTSIPSCVRGYHIYNDIWKPNIGDELECKRDPSNIIDRYAVSVLNCDRENRERIVGHLPRKISHVCSLFLRRGCSIKLQITGKRRYSSDLEQGGLEIPCLLMFEGADKDISKLK